MFPPVNDLIDRFYLQKLTVDGSIQKMGVHLLVFEWVLRFVFFRQSFGQLKIFLPSAVEFFICSSHIPNR